MIMIINYQRQHEAEQLLVLLLTVLVLLLASVWLTSPLTVWATFTVTTSVSHVGCYSYS